MKLVWLCVNCGKTEVHNESESSCWENAYAPSITLEEREYFGTLVGEAEEWDIWGALCPECVAKVNA